MAVPSGDVGNFIALCDMKAADDVFGNFVQSMADMKRSIGVGGAIVECEWFGIARALPCVMFIGTSL